MTSDPLSGIVTVGSGRAARAGIAPKAALLDRAAAAGLAVPRSWIVPDGTEASAVRSLEIDRPVAVRSAFGAEDAAGASMAGWFDSFLDVAPDEVESMVDVVRASARRRTGTFRRDVLIMDMVGARHAGVAFTEPDHLVDIVNVTDGLGDRLVRGEVAGRRVELHQFDDASGEGPWAERLRHLLAEVRREFGAGPDRRGWDIEWADDGVSCQLVQIRPITAPLTRVETLTVANHREILPALPSTFMTSLIESCADELYGWWRDRSGDLPRSRPFVVVRGGRPFINLSLLEDTLAIIGLPTRLVAEGFGGRPVHDRPADPARLLRHATVIARLGAAQIGALIGHRRRCEQVARIGADRAPDWHAAVRDAQRAYVAMVTGMMPLSSAAAPGMAVLSRTGTLQRHAHRHRTVTTEMALLLANGARASFLERFGHRGIYESDLARPRYVEEPPQPAGTAPRTGHPGGGRPPLRRRRPSAAEVLTTPLWWLTRRPIAAREEFRDAAMRGFLQVRRSLLRLADQAASRGQIPSVDAVWMLDVHELRSLDRGAVFGPSQITARQAERARLASIDVPDLVRSDTDADDWAQQAADGHPLGSPGAPGVLRGIGLGGPTVEGRVVILREPSGSIPEGSIVVAPAVDAGWMQVFNLAAAMVIETGGDLSHGSILLRELGVPAVTNVGAGSRGFGPGDVVRVDAGRGLVSRVTVAP
jgi:pyruvate,water dikinase